MKRKKHIEADEYLINDKVALTEFEVVGLRAAFNFADGHAYHRMPKELMPIMNRIKTVWRESSSKEMPELEEKFKRAMSRIIRSTVLGNHSYYSLCPTASNSIDIAAAWLASNKYSVGLLEPVFDNLFLILKRRGISICDIQESDLKDIQQLEKKIERHNLKALFIVTPNNPTGFELSREEFRQIASLCSKKGLALVIDKTFRLYSRSSYDEYQILTNYQTKYIVIEDTGKTWPTHETKVSLMAYSESIASEVRSIYEEIYLCHSKFAITLLATLIERTHRIGIEKIIWEEIDKRRSRMREALKDIPLIPLINDDCCPIPLEWMDCSQTGLNDLELVKKLKGFEIAVLPGRFFFWNSPEKHVNTIRISLLRSDAIFEKGIESIKYAINS